MLSLQIRILMAYRALAAQTCRVVKERLADGRLDETLRRQPALAR